MAIEIKLSVLRKQVDNGMKVDELAEEYKLPKSQVRQVLKEAGLKIRKLKRDSAFKLVDDTKEEGDKPEITDTTATQEAPAPVEVPTTTEIPSGQPAPVEEQDDTDMSATNGGAW